MILTRHEIAQLMIEGKLAFEPQLDGYQNQPHAVDLRLGTQFYLPKTWHLTSAGREVVRVDVTESDAENFEKIELNPGQFFELAPGESIIASTLEKVSLRSDNIMGVLYPRSSVNRRGLSVDLTGIVDVHYSGHLMIPIHNRTSQQIIRIYPGERICQLVFEELANGLQKDDAQRHGVNKAKYEGANAANLSLKKDNDQELAFIRKGDFSSLKKIDYLG
jgi:dCTP deaminase